MLVGRCDRRDTVRHVGFHDLDDLVSIPDRKGSQGKRREAAQQRYEPHYLASIPFALYTGAAFELFKNLIRELPASVLVALVLVAAMKLM